MLFQDSVYDLIEEKKSRKRRTMDEIPNPISCSRLSRSRRSKGCGGFWGACHSQRWALPLYIQYLEGDSDRVSQMKSSMKNSRCD